MDATQSLRDMLGNPSREPMALAIAVKMRDPQTGEMRDATQYSDGSYSWNEKPKRFMPSMPRVQTLQKRVPVGVAGAISRKIGQPVSLRKGMAKPPPNMQLLLQQAIAKKLATF